MIVGILLAPRQKSHVPFQESNISVFHKEAIDKLLL